MIKLNHVTVLLLLFVLNSVAWADTEGWKEKPPEYWKNQLSPEAFSVCREGLTEPPFSGNLGQAEGFYTCSSCGQKLFSSEHKFDSGTGWPSFTEPADTAAVSLHQDMSHGMERTEVRCSRCGAHLGHVFNDGPGPTGKRYCINAVCLKE